MNNKLDFHVRIPRELLKFLKIRAAYLETSMNTLIEDILNKYKNKHENKLTSKDNMG